MRFRFDFSLFQSPTEPYGCVTGFVELSFQSQSGAPILLLAEDAGSGRLVLRVESVLEQEDGDSITLMLENHLVDGLAAAEALARRLEGEGQYFVDVY